jgi:hypothetical protein
LILSTLTLFFITPSTLTPSTLTPFTLTTSTRTSSTLYSYILNTFTLSTQYPDTLSLTPSCLTFYPEPSPIALSTLTPSFITNSPVRIRVRIGPQHPHVSRKRRLNGVVLWMRPEKPRSRVTVGVAR